DTLFKGMILAMEKNSKIKFVSTGGEIPEQDMKTYPRFLSMINSSPYKDRFVMKGWVAGEDVPNYYLEADVGINIDKDIYEVRLGSKNRILDWFRAGLCVLSSNVCELTDIIEKEKIGYTFKPYDSNDLSAKLIYLANHPDEVKKTAIAGKKYGLLNFNFNKTTEKLQKWVESPTFSPDRGKERKLFFSREEALENLEQITLRQKKMIEEREKRISELEGIVKKGFAYRVYNYFKIARRKMLH
ncbi:MAG: glycosyltransferase, partial [Actinobacteria bacterium]|nr:glycosyltransferase [Actinomycetota bacterium]